MDLPDVVISGIGTLLLFFLGKYITAIKGKVLKVVDATDEFLDIIREALLAAEDHNFNPEEWRKIEKEVKEFKSALDEVKK